MVSHPVTFNTNRGFLKHYQARRHKGTAGLNTAVFWEVVLGSLVDTRRRFEAAYNLYR
jgi:hypothetical protein